MVIAILCALAWTVNKIIPHKTPGFSALTDEEAKLLVRTCTRQEPPNTQNPPCFIKQDDQVFGLSMIVTGSLPSGGAQGVVSSFSRQGDTNFGDNIPTYTKYPRGKHILPDDPQWSTFQNAYQNGGKLVSSTTP